MGGSNPYIKSQPANQPSKNFTIQFIGVDGQGQQTTEQTVDVDVAQMPTSGTGLPGSILDIALASGIDIDHACGGVCACATCHVVVREGFESLSPASDDEEDMLDTAPGLKPTSRLSCQAIPSGACPRVVVEIPAWNRNAVRE